MPPRLAMVIRPLNDDRFRIARQIGVTDIVTCYPGPAFDDLKRVKDRVEDAGLRLAVIEDELPMADAVLGKPGRDRQIRELTRFIEHMGRLGVGVLCYNFMPRGDATRTNFEVPERGGAVTTGFDVAQARALPDHPDAPVADEQQWSNLAWLLERIVPAASDAGVKLAMHPDDPPIPRLQGMPHIMRDPGAFDRLLEMDDRPANGLTFCQGCFSEMNADIPALVRRLADRIHYIHVRDVRGCPTRFVETFHDNGPTDMFAAMRAYCAIGFDGPLRPDHVPLLHGETDPADGYSFLGRLHAVGYLTGLMQAARATLGAAG